MKKRAMKKWIPKDLCYCYGCKWLSFNKTKHEQLSGYCKYLHSGDWMKDGTFLLWDMCKECGEHDNDNLYYLREAKREGRDNLKEERRNK